MSEIWKKIPGFEEHYAISDHGVIRSIPRKGVNSSKRPISASFAHDGYARVVLSKNGKRHNKMIHALVLEAFVGPRPEGFLVRHLNGDRTDNRLENLTWGTALENQRDRITHGTDVRGEKNPQSSLTEQQVVEMRIKRHGGASLKELALEFGVTKTLVSTICRGRAWAHARGPVVASFQVNHGSKITNEQAVEIRNLRASGEKLKDIARRFGVDHTAIASICLGKTKRSAGGPITRVKEINEDQISQSSE